MAPEELRVRCEDYAKLFVPEPLIPARRTGAAATPLAS